MMPGYSKSAIVVSADGHPDLMLWVDDMEFGYIAK